jgi:hypothetical protein
VTPATARFRNRRAVIVWGFALLWDAAIVLLAAIVRAEGGGWKGWLAFGVFGLAGLGLSVFALKAPLLGLDVGSSGVTVTRRYPLWRSQQVWPLSEVAGAKVVEESDGEGGAYYVCRIELRQAPPIDLSGRSRRQDAEAEAARFNTAAGHRRDPRSQPALP